MAKLIPGKIRTEGIELYETGKVQIIKMMIWFSAAVTFFKKEVTVFI